MMDAIGLAAAIRSRKVSCLEVMTAYLDHIERLNPKVNAIVALQDRGWLLAQAGERLGWERHSHNCSAAWIGMLSGQCPTELLCHSVH
jgi:Asp-tRNA(Asn)/Glu-tRNA(Gln) amidotransferase A subunit family amidase